MKERIALLIIISFLIAFLVIFQNYFNTMWAIIFLIGFMSLYSFYMYCVTKYRKRKLKKNPPINEKMIRAMFLQMGRKPSEAQIKAVMNSMKTNKK
jgi:uncharacterized protein YneF (UPF0154 family)